MPSGQKYWKLEDEVIAPGYPRSIHTDWQGLPGNIDAAFTWTNGRTYFFKVHLFSLSIRIQWHCVLIHYMDIYIHLWYLVRQGSRYWRFTNFKLDADYPKDLSEGFAGVPSNIDTALVWSGNGKIYFFKGSLDWTEGLLFCLFFFIDQLPFSRRLLSTDWLYTQAVNIGASIRNRSHPSNQHTRNPLPIGKVCPTIWTRLSNSPTATAISSKTDNIGASTTGVSRYTT